MFYNYLINSFSLKFAKDYLFANEESIKNIKSIVDKENINCDFEYQNNFVYTTKKDEVPAIEKEYNAILSLDYNCELVTKTSLPFDIEKAICFKNQAQFNSVKYCAGLCNSIIKNNGKIFEDTCAIDVKLDKNSYLIYTKNNHVSAKYVIIATHYPFINFPGFYFSKMYQSTSYLIAVDTDKTLFNGMYISAFEPTFSFRSAKYGNKKLLLIGGMDHNTGHASSFQDTYGKLEFIAKKFYPNSKILFKWNSRDCISLDKLPYIGLFSSNMPNMFVGTGFKKWGMTLSNVASKIVVDKICGNYNKYEYLFKSSRLNPIKNRDEFKNMIVQSSNSLIFDKLKKSNVDFSEISNDSGGIVEINNKKVGIYKDKNGKIYAVNPICTHLGCLLSWNDIDKTWDCPCHGSRFSFNGTNLYDPAFKNLDFYDL